MTLLCSLLLSAVPATQAPVQDTELLTLYIADAETFFADPKDAGLLEALRMIEARVSELPNEIPDLLQVPPELFPLVAGLLTGEKSLRIGMTDDPGMAFPLYAQLDVMEGDAASAQRLAETLMQFGRMGNIPYGEAREDGLYPIHIPPPVDVAFGSKGESVILSVGKTLDQRMNPSTTDLPESAALTFMMHLDVGAAFQAAGKIMAMRSPSDAADIREFAEAVGFDELIVDVVAGVDSERSYSVARLPGYAHRASEYGLMPNRTLGAADLDLIPANAIWASINAFNAQGTLDYMLDLMEEDLAEQGVPDPLGMIAALTGFHVEEDLIAHIGDVGGWYTSDATGGGGLLSLVAFLELRNPEGMMSTLERLEDIINAFGSTAGRGYARTRTWSRGETQYTSMVFPGLPVPIEPTFAISGNYLFVGLSPGAAVAAVAEATTPGGLGDNPRFVENLPYAVNASYAVSFADNPRLLRDGYGLMTLLCSALVNGTRSPVDAERDAGMILPTFPELVRGAKASVWCSYVDGPDWVSKQHGDPSVLVNLTGAAGSILSSPLLLAVPVALMAGVAQTSRTQSYTSTPAPEEMIFEDF